MEPHLEQAGFSLSDKPDNRGAALFQSWQRLRHNTAKLPTLAWAFSPG
jgi:hypothetical protein